MEIKVVNLRREKYDIYIGRPSRFGNPFVIGRDGTREEVIQKFRDYILTRPKLIAEAKKCMPGKRLGCFCKPLPCHGDVWKEIVEESNNNATDTAKQVGA